MKYKVGDKVRIKNNLDVNSMYGGWMFNCLMEEYKGKLATITEAIDFKQYYHLDTDNKRFCWTDEMLEGVETEYNIQNDDITITLKQSEIIISGCKKFEIAVTGEGLKFLFDGKEVEDVG